MEYSFNTEHAERYGVSEAIVIRNLLYWISKNKANNKNEFDGYTYTYNSVKAFTTLFPFWSERQIGRILKSLEEQNVIKIGNFNKAKYDRTKWYAFVDYNSIHQMVKCNKPKGKKDLTKTKIAITEKVQPIPNTKTTNINTNKNPYYTELLFVYDKFCQETFDAPAKINGAEGKALKQIISYLKGLCKAKGDDSLEAVKNAFRYILSNWANLEPFLQKQIKLTQINSNLANIINQLKNGTEKPTGNNLAEEILAKYK
tara:strand:+ start:318 stop:1088 length:771 start_codon:yes stop_codon:yes gene_type:complete